MLEQLAHHGAGRTNVVVARLMTQGVVYLLEAIHVAHHNAKLANLALGDGLIELLFLDGVGALVLDASQLIAMRDGTHGRRAPLALLLARPHGGKVAQHNAQREHEQPAHQQDAPRDAPVEHHHHVAHKLRLAEGEVLRQPIAAVVGLDTRHGLAGRAAGYLSKPGKRREENQRQQHEPRHDGLAKAPLLVQPQKPMEEDEARDAPNREEEVRLGGHGIGRGEAWHQKHQPQADHERKPYQAAPRGKAIPMVARIAQGTCRDEAIDDGGAERGHVNDPPHCRSSQEGHGQRHQHHQADAARGHARRIRRGKTEGNDLILRKGEKQPAQRHDVANKARDDERQKRHHQYDHTHLAQIAARGEEGRKPLQTSQVANVEQVGIPGVIARRIGHHRQQRDHDVERRDRHKRDRQHAEGPRAREGELLRQVRDVFEANEGPRRHAGDAHYLRDRHRTGNKRGLEGEPACTMSRRGCAEGDHATHHEGERKADHGALNTTLARRAEGTRQKNRADGKQRLAQIDLIAKDLVAKAPLEDAAHEEARKERQRRGVCPEHGHIGQTEKPCREHAVVKAKDVARKAVGPARAGMAPHEVVVVARNNQHDGHAHQHAQGAPGRTGLHQVGIGRDNKRAPSHAGTKGKGPGAKRCQIGIETHLFGGRWRGLFDHEATPSNVRSSPRACAGRGMATLKTSY